VVALNPVRPTLDGGWVPRDEDRWDAVLARDGREDGTFVFGVRSTGIYCRPSCPARRPRREQVVFFALPEAAEGAGFRACRRCRPREAGRGDPRAAWVRRLCRHIDEHLDEPLTLAGLSGKAGVSPRHLQRMFKRLMGITPRQYAEARRLGVLKAHLKGGRAVTEATYEAGYGSSSRVYERAPRTLGMTPATYGRGGRGMKLRYTIADCPLGRLLVAGTARGLSTVALADEDARLEKALHEEYPAAEIRRDDATLGPWLRVLLRHLRGQEPHLDLPLDVQATAFQWRVWSELRKIPFGETRSYGEVARALGQPTAARAVARACATNRVSLVIPCHRVIAEDGRLSGYRWGIERKRALLAREERSVRDAGQRSK
jgi:AraC family transcriptional regulator of adaptative response/methylated-DNA-[protein]-cysteine methyltransferase